MQYFPPNPSGRRKSKKEQTGVYGSIDSKHNDNDFLTNKLITISFNKWKYKVLIGETDYPKVHRML